MKILVFDTETTGLPEYKFRKRKRIRVMPHMLQLAWVVYDVIENKLLRKCDRIVRLPDNMIVPPESVAIHNITQDMMLEQGKSLRDVLVEFVSDLKQCDYLVAHNIPFDKEVLQTEFNRIGMINHFDVLKSSLVEYCTMRESKELCNIQTIDYVNGGTRIKFPKLIELHRKLFRHNVEDLHNALHDVYVCLRCFYKMIYDRDIMTVNRELRTLFKRIAPDMK